MFRSTAEKASNIAKQPPEYYNFCFHPLNKFMWL